MKRLSASLFIVPLAAVGALLISIFFSRTIPNTASVDRESRSPEISVGATNRFTTSANLSELSSKPVTEIAAENIRNLPKVRAITEQLTAEPFVSAREVSNFDTPTSSEGQFIRTKLLHTNARYPLVRTRETHLLDPNTGSDTIVDFAAMIADHLLVQRNPSSDEETFLAQIHDMGLAVRRKLPMSEKYLISFEDNDGRRFEEVERRLQSPSSAIISAEPDYFTTLLHTAPAPIDPHYPLQWHLTNTGQYVGGLPGADIHAREAWAHFVPRIKVIVAIVGTGIDFNHEDLAGRFFQNPNEALGDKNGDGCPGLCGVDDDHDGQVDEGNLADDDENGLVDDISGWDFVPSQDHPEGDSNPDGGFHSTHLAGTIAGVSGNGKGISGINSSVEILPVSFFKDYGLISDAVEGLAYAINMGATVINTSWALNFDLAAVRNEVARAEQKGILIVAGAGNEGLNAEYAPLYPAAYPNSNVISVAASDQNDELAWFSSYGPTSVDLAAPGVGIVSSMPGNSYGTMDGSSTAAPQVTAAVAMLKTHAPNLSASDIKRLILDGVDKVPALSGKLVSGGRLNLARSLQLVGQNIAIADVAINDAQADGGVGNGDGVFNPGETVKVTVDLKNLSETALSNLTATVAPEQQLADISVFSSPVSITTIAARSMNGHARVEFRVQAASAVAKNTIIPLVISITGSAFAEARTFAILVQNTAQLEGTVLLDGQPLPNAVVQSHGVTAREVVTDSAGRYRVGLAPGNYRLNVSLRGIPFWGDRHIQLNDAQPERVDFEFFKAFEGRVTDVDTGAPISKLILNVHEFSFHRVSDVFIVPDNGEFLLAADREHVVPFILNIKAPGRYIPQQRYISGLVYGGKQEIELAPGSANLKITRRFIWNGPTPPYITDIASDGTILVGGATFDWCGAIAGACQHWQTTCFIVNPDGSSRDFCSEVTAGFGDPWYRGHRATGMNSNKEVIGLSSLGKGWVYRLAESKIYELPPPAGFNQVYPISINSHGDVLGVSSIDNGSNTATIWRRSATSYAPEIFYFNNPNVLRFDLTQLADDGTVLAEMYPIVGSHYPYLYKDGVGRPLGNPENTSWANANGITSLGTVFGYSYNLTLGTRLFAYADGRFRLRDNNANLYGYNSPVDYDDQFDDFLGVSYPPGSTFLWGLTATLQRARSTVAVQDLLAENDRAETLSRPAYDWFTNYFVENDFYKDTYLLNLPSVRDIPERMDPYLTLLVTGVKGYTAAHGYAVVGLDVRTQEYFVGLVDKVPTFKEPTAKPVVTPTPVATPMPTATPTVTPTATPTPLPPSAAVVKSVRGDFDGDGESDIGSVSKGKGATKSSLMQHKIKLSASGVDKKIKFGGSTSFAAHGHYIPGNNWQLGYVRKSRGSQLEWSILDPVNGTTATVIFGKSTDRVLGGCSLAGNDDLSDMALVRGSGTLLVRNSATGAVSEISLGMKASEAIVDIACGHLKAEGTGDQESLAVLTRTGSTRSVTLYNFKGALLKRIDAPQNVDRLLVVEASKDGVEDIVLVPSVSLNAKEVKLPLLNGDLAVGPALAPITVPAFSEISAGAVVKNGVILPGFLILQDGKSVTRIELTNGHSAKKQKVGGTSTRLIRSANFNTRSVAAKNKKRGTRP